MNKCEEDLERIHNYVTQNLIKLRGVDSEQVALWNDVYKNAVEIRKESLNRLNNNE